MKSDFASRWRRAYSPIATGIHVFDPDDEEFGGRTVRNFETIDLSVFRELSSAGPGEDDYDLICERMNGGDLTDDAVPIRRQDLALIERRIDRDQET